MFKERYRCVCFCLCMQTVGLVSLARLFLVRSADHFQCSIRSALPRKPGKGRTNLLFEKSQVGKISPIQVLSILSALKTMSDTVRKTPKQQRTCRGKSSEKTKPAQLSNCCYANSFKGCELIRATKTLDCCRFVSAKRPFFL